jgi:hypothetical protein
VSKADSEQEAGKHSENKTFCSIHGAPDHPGASTNNDNADYRNSGRLAENGIAIHGPLIHALYHAAARHQAHSEQFV